VSEQQTAYALLGGEQPLQRIVARFYAQMSADPRFAALRQTHAGPLDRAEQRLFMFLSGRLGGPDLYIEAFGHPRLRMRHLPFAIGPTERDQWVQCMDEAMRAEGVEEALRAALTEFFTAVAAQMQNREA
jgi:hemoglobin